MKQTKLIMGMPVTVEIIGSNCGPVLVEVFDYFKYIDNKFSTYKEDSEISSINRGQLKKENFSPDMKTIFGLAEQTKQESGGYFDIYYQGKYDPSGLVKGWAILQATKIIESAGFADYYIEAGGDIQSAGKNNRRKMWRIGIRNPFNIDQIVKVISADIKGVATSGTYIRGQHIYDPKNGRSSIPDIVSLTVVGPDICEADRFATAAFAMGKEGIYFIENMPELEGYMIDSQGLGTATSGFERYESRDWLHSDYYETN